MRKEVLDFYENYRIPVNKMVHVGVRRRGLTKDSVKKAAETVYDLVQSGEIQVEPILLSREVYRRSEYAKNDRTDMFDAIAELNKKLDEIKELATPWYVKLWRKFK